MDVVNPVINVTDLANSAYEFTLTVPANNVAAYKLSVNRNGGTFAPILEIKSFPASVAIKAGDIAAALGLSLADLNPGDKFDFLATTEDAAGNSASFANLNTDAKNPGERQAFKHTTYLSCPFVAADAAGTYTVTVDNFWEETGWEQVVVAGPGVNQVTIKDFNKAYTGESGWDVIVDVDPNTGIAFVAKQPYWSQAFGYGEIRVNSDGTGFVFSCSGTFALVLKYTVNAGSFGTYAYSMQRN
jgi:hypothetical protein